MAETKNKNKEKKNQLVTTHANAFKGASFDDVFNMDDKEKNRSISYNQKKEGKRLQLVSKINQLQMRAIQAESKFNLSLTDPTQDSVDILVEIDCFKKEQKLAVDLHNQLFPENIIVC